MFSLVIHNCLKAGQLVITFFDKEDCICHKNSPSIPPQPNSFYLTEKSKFNLGNTGQY